MFEKLKFHKVITIIRFLLLFLLFLTTLMKIIYLPINIIYIIKQVKKNEIFQEYIFEKMVNQDWIIWLYSETSMNAITYGVYDKESDKKEKENKCVNNL